VIIKQATGQLEVRSQ